MDHALLSTYLNDHLAGATAGSALAHRVAVAERNGPYGAMLGTIDTEIGEDRAALLRVMRALEVRPNRAKVAAGRLGERLGLLKTNRRIVHRSPLSRVLELEGLVIGVRGKLALWTALRALAPSEPALAGAGNLDDLIERAESQIRRLDDARLQAVQVALGDARQPAA